MRCRTITYTSTTVCPSHTVRQCASPSQPGVLPQTSYEQDMCEIAAAKACSQLGSTFSAETDDCKKFACVSQPSTCDVDADCSAAAQEAIQKSVPYCTWWRNQVLTGCSWQQQPSAEWEKQYQSQCVVSDVFSDLGDPSMPGLGWHRQYFFKFTQALRAGIPLYDRQVQPVDADMGMVAFAANVSSFSLTSSWAGKSSDDKLVQGFCITLIIVLVVAVLTIVTHVGVLQCVRVCVFYTYIHTHTEDRQIHACMHAYIHICMHADLCYACTNLYRCCRCCAEATSSTSHRERSLSSKSSVCTCRYYTCARVCITCVYTYTSHRIQSAREHVF